MKLEDLLKVLLFNQKVVITYPFYGELKDVKTNPVDIENNFIFLMNRKVNVLYKSDVDNLIHILLSN